MRNDHLVQILLVMSGHTKKVQVVAFLIICDLYTEREAIIFKSVDFCQFLYYTADFVIHACSL